ncbi:ferredoxin 1b [Leucoraja erinacea]|uniref:ferredoxin 1b n=1 Tax=Leucoraja erinaceus TaxID=7782 RepID=UPI0024562E27|nr:ferredoxin 1b [Leucoraja erinacea]
MTAIKRTDKSITIATLSNLGAKSDMPNPLSLNYYVSLFALQTRHRGKDPQTVQNNSSKLSARFLGMIGHAVLRPQSLCGILCGRARFFSGMPVAKVPHVPQRAVSAGVDATVQQKRFVSLSTTSRNSRSDGKLTVHFINRHSEKLTAVAKEGDSLLDVVMHHNLNIDGYGACEGTLACSTCHIIFDKETFQTLDTITDEELDMLDLAFGLTSTSRLGCQICLKKSLDGITVKIPKEVSDVRKAADAKEQL